MEPTEIWKPVHGYAGLYEVSDRGRVRSLERKVRDSRGRTRRQGARVLKQRVAKRGYRQVSLSNAGVAQTFFVHRVVLEAFVGHRPDGAVCRHLDDKPDNNRLSNLRWGTPSENMEDSVRNGTHARASQSQCKRGHALSGRNLIESTKGRACRACHYEHNNSRKQGRAFDQESADKGFERIQSGVRHSRRTT